MQGGAFLCPDGRTEYTESHKTGADGMQISIDHAKLIEFLRSEIDRSHPHKKPPYYFSRRVKEGNPIRMGLFDFLDDPVVAESLKDFCADINADWDSSRIADVLRSMIFQKLSDQHKVGNAESESVMKDRCVQIGSMIDDYLRSHTK